MVYHPDHFDIVSSSSDRGTATGFPLSAKGGHRVSSYVELLHKIASLNYHNSRFQLLFRGQQADYKSGKVKASNLYPSILRGFVPNKLERIESLKEQFQILAKAEKLLIECNLHSDLSENQLVRWAILQHYEVCNTPLLDLTASLQTALTFSIGDREYGWLYVFGFPQLTGGVSVSVESKTQVINLSQICPPEALRPHFQNGLLASDYPEIRSREESHAQRGMRGNNFSARLLTKFELINCNEWTNEGFLPTKEQILFPNSTDTWYKVTREIQSQLHA